MINLNSTSNWFHSDELEEMDGAQTVIPRKLLFINLMLQYITSIIHATFKYSRSILSDPENHPLLMGFSYARVFIEKCSI